MGQAKWVPGQISFMTAPEGRLPNVQPLIEAGLPYAPYIEHGSWTTGQPDIARYGRDPYRGLSSLPADYYSTGREAIERESREAGEAAQQVIREKLPPITLAMVGFLTGAGAGIGGALVGKWWLGGLIGAAAGGMLGYSIGTKVAQYTPPAPATAGLSGVLAVM